MRYKRTSIQEKWKIAETNFDQNGITISRLMANTCYVFQVRGVLHDQEGRYGPLSDAVKTTESPATHLLERSLVVAYGHPSKYRLCVEELNESRNPVAKTRKFILGKSV